jgi:death on curing protein
MKEPEWVLPEVVFAAHEQSLAQFGGSAGVRDAGLLESALGKPPNLFAYGRPDLFELAAVFLELNGRSFQATEADAALQTLALAAGEMTEAQFAAWLRAYSRPG